MFKLPGNNTNNIEYWATSFIEIANTKHNSVATFTHCIKSRKNVRLAHSFVSSPISLFLTEDIGVHIVHISHVTHRFMESARLLYTDHCQRDLVITQWTEGSQTDSHQYPNNKQVVTVTPFLCQYSFSKFQRSQHTNDSHGGEILQDADGQNFYWMKILSLTWDWQTSDFHKHSQHQRN